MAELQRLGQAIDRTGADKLIILGDLFHTASGREEAVMKAVTTWREQYATLAIYLVRGNHDRHAGDPPDEWRFTVSDGPTPGPYWVLNHEPLTPSTGYALVGHLHPAVQLTGKGKQALKLPCFWFGPSCGVLPAFGAFLVFGEIGIHCHESRPKGIALVRGGQHRADFHFGTHHLYKRLPTVLKIDPPRWILVTARVGCGDDKAFAIRNIDERDGA